MPSVSAIRSLLFDLLGKTVKIVPAGGAVEDSGAVAVYADDQGELSGVLVCDLAFASSAGAALTMVPPHIVSQSMADQALDPMLAENLYEVFNVASQWFNASGRPHVRLQKMVTRDELTDDIRGVLDKPAVRRDMQVEIADYPGGNLAFLSA